MQVHPLTPGFWRLALFLSRMRENADVLRGSGHVAQQLLLPMFLSEPGGVSGRRRIGIYATKTP